MNNWLKKRMAESRLATAEPTKPEQEERCLEYAAPGPHPLMGFRPCELTKGHTGNHQTGGNCFIHGRYIGDKCPQWPTCIESVYSAPARPAPAQPTEINDKKGWDYDPQATLDAMRAPVQQPSENAYSRDDCDCGQCQRAGDEVEHRAETSAEPAGEREAFEKWGRTRTPDFPTEWNTEGREYASTVVEEMWQAWQAAAHVKADAASVASRGMERDRMWLTKLNNDLQDELKEVEAERDALRQELDIVKAEK